MTRDILENEPMSNLLRGYTDTNVCVWCGEQLDGPKLAEKHVLKCHSLESRFYTIMGADSVLNMSSSDKLMYQRLFEQKKAQDIVDEMEEKGVGSIAAETVHSKYRYLRESSIKAKLNVMFTELLQSQRRPRKSTKPKNSTVDAKQKIAADWVPNIDSDGKICQFNTKSQSHDPDKKLLHPTIVLLCVRLFEDEPHILISNRGGMLWRGPFAAQPKPGDDVYDLAVGEHVELVDTGLELDENNRPKKPATLTETHFLAALHRGALEELDVTFEGGRKMLEQIFSMQNLTSPASGVKTFATLPFSGPMPDGGFNNELTQAYIWQVPQQLAGHLICRDTYRDSLGVLVPSREFPTKFMPFSECLERYKRQKESGEEIWLDGAGRVWEYCLANSIDSMAFARLLKKMYME
ncbi:hypothetical protein LJC49_06305 [Ruminococcaceae bacterium OttesenSCG-928-I18]|nr:hypothetical protein [Ruminococcaceae bacterium OttesenSCG-928-I18]